MKTSKTICYAATIQDKDGFQKSFVIKSSTIENAMHYVRHYGENLVGLFPCSSLKEAKERVELWNQIAADDGKLNIIL